MEGKEMKKHLIPALSVFMMLSAAGCSGSTASGTYTPGTYTGTGKSDALGHTITVDVTVSADKIEKIEIKEEDFDFDQPYDTVPQAVIDANSTEGIDSVSGSTETSTALIDAINNALAQAKGEGGEEQTGNVPVTYTAGTYTGHGVGYE